MSWKFKGNIVTEENTPDGAVGFVYKIVHTPTGKADTKGGDKTKIEADGGLNLSKDDKKLTKARGGALNEKKYSDSVKK